MKSMFIQFCSESLQGFITGLRGDGGGGAAHRGRRGPGEDAAGPGAGGLEARGGRRGEAQLPHRHRARIGREEGLTTATSEGRWVPPNF